MANPLKNERMATERQQRTTEIETRVLSLQGALVSAVDEAVQTLTHVSMRDRLNAWALEAVSQGDLDACLRVMATLQANAAKISNGVSNET